MALILPMTKSLSQRPQPVALPWVRLRTYREQADIEIWLELRRRAFARSKLGVGDWNADDFRREFLDKAWWRPERMWFAEAEDQQPAPAVGSVTLARRGESDAAIAVVHWLVVLPRYRRRGIGRLLMATLEAAAWDAGERQIALETHAKWHEAVGLYEALGYAAVNA